jgi:hypothetical protein
MLGGKLTAPHPEMATYRATGWSSALAAAGLAPRPDLVIPLHDYSIAEARATITDVLAAGPRIDGIFAVTDEVAIGALAGLHDAGSRVPDDVQLVGFDNLDISAHLTPGLTTIDPDRPTMVAEALRLLRRQLADKNAAPEHIVSTVSLVTRGSTRNQTPLRRRGSANSSWPRSQRLACTMPLAGTEVMDAVRERPSLHSGLAGTCTVVSGQPSIREGLVRAVVAVQCIRRACGVRVHAHVAVEGVAELPVAPVRPSEVEELGFEVGALPQAEVYRTGPVSSRASVRQRAVATLRMTTRA